jgi:hypothetical protein
MFSSLIPVLQERLRKCPLHLDLRLLPASLFFVMLVSGSAFAGSGRAHPTIDSSYVSALATVDHFLQAWQSGDLENGVPLLTEHAKKNMNPDELEKFFSDSEIAAYEIDRGKLLGRDRYEFHVVLVSTDSSRRHPRRRFSSIVVVNTGNNGWALDKLP